MKRVLDKMAPESLEPRAGKKSFAAIGSDGRCEVVWGLGETVEAAEADARVQALEADCDPELTRTVEVDEATKQRIDAGNVDVESLGLSK